jgi:hypothetical protein
MTMLCRTVVLLSVLVPLLVAILLEVGVLFRLYNARLRSQNVQGLEATSVWAGITPLAVLRLKLECRRYKVIRRRRSRSISDN